MTTKPPADNILRLPDGTEYEGRLQFDDDGKPIVEIAKCGTCGFRWNDKLITSLTPAPSGRCPNEYGHKSEEEMEALAWRDYFPVQGTIIEVSSVDCYDERDDPTTLEFATPKRFVVSADMPSKGDIERWMGEHWLDPVYDVEPCDPNDPDLVGFRSFWVYGTSRNADGSVHSTNDWKPTGEKVPERLPTIPDFIDWTKI